MWLKLVKSTFNNIIMIKKFQSPPNYWEYGKISTLYLLKTTINMSKARNQAHFESLPLDERRKVREKKF